MLDTMLNTKELYKMIIDTILEKLYALNIPHKTLGFYIRSFHVNLPIYIILFLVYGPKWLGLTILFFLILSFISLFVFKGCILSKLEKKLDGEDIIIIDPLVYLLRLENNNNNRFYVSIFSGLLYVYLSVYIYHKRFN